MQLFVDRFRAKNTKATQAQSKLKQIERLKEDMVETPDGPVRRWASVFRNRSAAAIASSRSST